MAIFADIDKNDRVPAILRFWAVYIQFALFGKNVHVFPAGNGQFAVKNGKNLQFCAIFDF